MAYQALYRRWRPNTFEEVIGQEAIIKTLRHQIETGHIAHAYLFCGCRGTGKTTLAKIMSRAINCQNPKGGDPCCACAACKSILEESTLDVLELDAASNNSVDNIRELLEQVRYPAQVGKYKVYIIDEVHMLSTAAFNALLKTLEEPPPHVVFILATTEPQKLPATILSRVQRYDFGRIPSSLIIERMELALSELSITADEEALQMVARAAEGAMRDAFSILDMCIAGAANGHISAEHTREVLGASDRDFLFAFADSIGSRSTREVMAQIDALMRAGREPQVFLREMTAHFRALLTVGSVPSGAASLLDVTDEDERRYREQAKAFSQEGLLRILGLFMRTEGELRYASTPRIGLEVTALESCMLPKGEDVSALVERVADLEAQLLSLQGALSNAIQNGQLKAAGERPAQAAKAALPVTSPPVDKPSQEQADPPAASGETQPPLETDAKAIWQKTLTAISKAEPPLFGLLRGERFLGAKGNVYQLQIPFAKKDFTYLKLSQAARKDKISQILSEVAGAPSVFEPVLESDLAGEKRQVHQGQVQDMLVEAFGRDLVQIDEEDRA